jgi:hypothetical protein
VTAGGAVADSVGVDCWPALGVVVALEPLLFDLRRSAAAIPPTSRTAATTPATISQVRRRSGAGPNPPEPPHSGSEYGGCPVGG